MTDAYYKTPSLRVILSASVTKMRAYGGKMAVTGHDAIYFRGFGGRQIPLGVFGIMTATPRYFQIKPFAIWR